MAHRFGSLRRTHSVAIEGIADIREALLPVNGHTRVAATRLLTCGSFSTLQTMRSRLSTRSEGKCTHPLSGSFTCGLSGKLAAQSNDDAVEVVLNDQVTYRS